MKVTSTSSASGPRKSGGAKSSGEGFRLTFPEDGAAPAGPTAGAGAVSGVIGVDAILALQGGGGQEARGRALRKGRRLLDALDRLQAALLGTGPTQGHLDLLKRALADPRERTDDPGLDDVLNWAEVRAAVEAAKLERASGGE